jgi:hypothetical protein
MHQAQSLFADNIHRYSILRKIGPGFCRGQSALVLSFGEVLRTVLDGTVQNLVKGDEPLPEAGLIPVALAILRTSFSSEVVANVKALEFTVRL